MKKSEIKRIAYDIISHLIDDSFGVNPYLVDDEGKYLYSAYDINSINEELARLAQKFWEKGNPEKDKD